MYRHSWICDAICTVVQKARPHVDRSAGGGCAWPHEKSPPTQDPHSDRKVAMDAIANRNEKGWIPEG